MLRQLDAIFESGVLRPLEPLVLSEKQHVRLILDDHPAQQPAEPVATGYNPRHEELLWLATHAAPYAGQWVALNGSQLIAHGPDAAAVRAAARAANVERPLLTHLPEQSDLPFGGW